MNLRDICEICSENFYLLAFLQYFRLIKSEQICPKCSSSCCIVNLNNKFYFRCKKALCTFTVTVSPKGSWFHQSRISYENALLLIYYFVHNNSVTEVCSQLSLNKTTVSGWFKICREVCILECQRNKKIGGVGKTVEVDEFDFGKRKYKSSFREPQWVFGGVERESGDCFLTLIGNRNSSKLLDYIIKYIEPGTTIISDGWKGYKDLAKNHFKHLTVNHSITFKEKNTGSHTNTIEGTWSQVKRSLPTAGLYKNHLFGYLATFMFLRKFELQERFINFIRIIPNHYS